MYSSRLLTDFVRVNLYPVSNFTAELNNTEIILNFVGHVLSFAQRKVNLLHTRKH
jgi:hypothetical protein